MTYLATILCRNGRATKTVEYGFQMQEAIDNNPEPLLRSVFYSRHRDTAIEKDMYACGLLPARYPMPAVIYTVQSFEDKVGWALLLLEHLRWIMRYR